MEISLCRLCATESNTLVPIFGIEGMRLRLAYTINKLLPFMVTPRDTLPLQVCRSCNKQLVSTTQFIRKCLVSQSKLKNILQISEDYCDDPIKSLETNLSEFNESEWNRSDVLQSSHAVITAEDSKPTQDDDSESTERFHLKKIKLTLDANPNKYHALNIPSEILDNAELHEIHIEQPCSISDPVNDGSDERGARDTSNENELKPVEVSSEETFEFNTAHIWGNEGGSEPNPVEVDSGETSECNTAHIWGNKGGSEPRPVEYNREETSESNTGHDWENKGESDDSKHVCIFCNESFTRKAHLFHHQTTMHPDSVFRCKFCLKVFYDKEEVSSHELAHLKVMPPGQKVNVYVNDHLKRTNLLNDLKNVSEKLLGPSSVKSNDVEPVKSGTKSEIPSNNPISFLKNSDAGDMECSTCNIEFETRRQKRKHMRLTHKILLPCRFCPRTFKYGFALRRHEGFHRRKNNKELVCNTCKKIFDSKDLLKDHQLIHMHMDGLKCEVCLEEFSQEKDLENHIQAHAGESSYLCEICGQSFEVFIVFRVHKMSHMYGDYSECEVCKKPFFGSNRLKDHMEEKHPCRNGKKFACKFCNESFSTIGLLKEHKTVHDKLGYTCDICNKTYGSLKKLRSHKPTHSVDRNYLCEKCGKGFKSSSALHKHRYLCQVALACNVCDKEFDSNTRLRVHMRVHTGEKPFVCNICGKGFHASWSLNQHTVTHNLVKIPCPLCGALFNRRSNMLTHKKRHRVPCEKCGQVFPHTPSLLAHQKVAHLTGENDGVEMIGTGDGQGENGMANWKGESVTSSKENNDNSSFAALKCGECGKFFVTALDLKAHMMSHSDARPYKCNICGKSWRLKKTLQNHMITHSGRMPYQCRYCTCTFLLHQSLLRHEKGHTVGKPYNCSECGQSFWTQLSLEKHAIRHSLAHSKTTEMKYPCNFCDKVFGRKSTLFIHKRIHSAHLNIACKYCPRKFSQLRFLQRHKCAFNPNAQVSNSDMQEGFLSSLTLLAEETCNGGENTATDTVLNEEVVYDMDSSTPYAEIIVISQSMDEFIVGNDNLANK